MELTMPTFLKKNPRLVDDTFADAKFIKKCSPTPMTARILLQSCIIVCFSRLLNDELVLSAQCSLSTSHYALMFV